MCSSDLARSVSDWFAYIPFRIAAALFGAFPEPLVRWLGTNAGGLASNRFDMKRPLLTRHMRRVMGPGASDSEIREAVDGMYRSYGRYWAETFWFRPRRRRAIIDSVERVNFGPVHEAIAAGRGIVFAVPHIGNWEISVQLNRLSGVEVSGIYRKHDYPPVEKYFHEKRESTGSRHYPLKGAVDSIFKECGAGNCMAPLIDQNDEQKHNRALA